MNHFVMLLDARCPTIEGFSMDEPNAFLLDLDRQNARKMLDRMDLVKGLKAIEPQINLVSFDAGFSVSILDINSDVHGDLLDRIEEECSVSADLELVYGLKADSLDGMKYLPQEYMNQFVTANNIFYQGRARSSKHEFESEYVTRKELEEFILTREIKPATKP